MPTTIEDIRAEDILRILQERYSVTPRQKLKITFEVVTSKEEDDENGLNIHSLGESVLEGFQEIVQAQESGSELTDARDFLREL